MNSINNITPSNGPLFHADVFCEVLSYLGIEDLGRVGQVCKQWNIFICENDTNKCSLWKNLFERTFHIKVPNNISGKEAVHRYRSPLIEKDGEMVNKCISFICGAKLGKKREFVCFSQKETSLPIFLIEQSWGTEKGLSGDVDEREVCRLPGRVKKFDALVDKEEYVYPIDKTMRLNVNGIDFCIKITIGLWAFYSVPSSHHDLRVNLFDPMVIEGVDVGWGNTLGYCSNVNDWKKPFELSCVNGNWSGLIPSSARVYKDWAHRDLIYTDSNHRDWYYGPAKFRTMHCGLEFKFVKIDSKGQITWEKHEGNRCSLKVAEFCGHKGVYLGDPRYVEIISQAWKEYFKGTPINF